MPIADTEFLFAMSPNDIRHREAMEILSSMGDLKIPDTSLFEFQVVLRARNKKPSEIAKAILALKQIFGRRIKEAQTINMDLFIRQADIQEKYDLTYFDSLVAASALAIDDTIVSDDRDFDRVDGLKRLPLKK